MLRKTKRETAIIGQLIRETAIIGQLTPATFVEGKSRQKAPWKVTDGPPEGHIYDLREGRKTEHSERIRMKEDQKPKASQIS